jgi:transcriptional regulator with XRE-family HTH domain
LCLKIFIQLLVCGKVYTIKLLYVKTREGKKMDMNEIGKNIAQIRKRNGFTQESLAEKLNITPQAVSKWETGIGLPEVSLLIALSRVFRVSFDEILQPCTSKNTIEKFISRNTTEPVSKMLDWVPRISRWNPPEGCDMWYSFPAMMATALVCAEAHEQKQTEITYSELNGRFRDLIHVTGLGYGFLWNTVQYHMIEELWHINNIEEMAAQVMGYYGRDFLWLTPADATIDEMRRLLKWSVAQGHPVMMEWAGGIPEFSIVTGYENDGDTLIGYTYCEECAAETNELGMFINPARWGEPGGNTQFRALVIGNKINPSVSDRDTIEYALKVMAKNEAGDKEFFLSHEYIAGDTALHAWLTACDTDENTLDFFKPITTLADGGLFRLFLDLNAAYTQKSILPYYKRLGGRSSRKVNDAVIQIDIAIGRICDEGDRIRNAIRENPENTAENAAACKTYIENLISHRKNMRGWLKHILDNL